MKKITLSFFAVAILLLSFITKTPSAWTLDTAHSNLRFSVTSLMISEIEGSFKMKESTITAQKEDFSDARVYMIAEVSSINTEIEERDEHLRGPDFFDAAKYPRIEFRSTAFEKTGDNKYKVTGDLSFHGITKQVVLDAIAKYGTHPMSQKTIAGFKVSGTIRRSDFKIAPSMGSSMLGDEVVIAANAQFAKN